MKYYLIAGEASGDLHASRLMRSLKAHDAEAEFRFYGGDLMQAEGGTLVKHYSELAYMGFVPVLLHLPTILRNMRQCKEDIRRWMPDVVILVDYPGFNLKIADYVKRHSICPVYYYISPKIWAWKEYRIKDIKRNVDELFSILSYPSRWTSLRRSTTTLSTMWGIRQQMRLRSGGSPLHHREGTGEGRPLLRCWLVPESRRLRITCRR